MVALVILIKRLLWPLVLIRWRRPAEVLVILVIRRSLMKLVNALSMAETERTRLRRAIDGGASMSPTGVRLASDSPYSVAGSFTGGMSSNYLRAAATVLPN